MLHKGCSVYHRLLVTVGERTTAWRGNSLTEIWCSFSKKQATVQAVKQAVSLIERVDREILETKMNN